MKDQVDSLKEMGISATFINSSIDYPEVKQRLWKIEKGEYKLLYIAPERLDSPRFCQLLQSLQIDLFAIDEAHCVSQWGHDFRPSYLNIPSVIDNLNKRPIIAAFTATATPRVRDNIIELLKFNNPNVYTAGFDRENLQFNLLKGINKDDFVLNYVEDNKDEAGIIYAATRKEVDRIYDYLDSAGYDTGRYHAGLSDLERKNTQDSFLFDDYKVIVATNAFGMGIDKSNVRYVIH
jgi:ATP-dependent DNA helicase RecQ